MAFTTAEFSILAFQLQRLTPGEIVLRLESESPHCPLTFMNHAIYIAAARLRSEIESIAGITPVVAFPFSNFAIPGNVTIDEAMITYEGFVTPQHMSCLISGEKRPKRHIHHFNNFLLLSCSCRVSRSQIRSLEGWGSGRRCHPWSRAGRAASASTPEEGAAGASPRPGRTEGPWSHSTRPTAARSASCRTGRPFPQVREHRLPWITLLVIE